MMYQVSKKSFDLFFSITLLVIMLIPSILVALAIKVGSKGPILFWSSRVGRANKLFNMPKFRTMKIGTPQVATHLLVNPDTVLTTIGGFLRRSSLDEIPQLWCILVGDMSVVGPRPALFNQKDLIEQRTKAGVHKVLPGLTGLAQINGRDELSIKEKVVFDKLYVVKQSMRFDLMIVFKTVFQVLKLEDVSH